MSEKSITGAGLGVMVVNPVRSSHGALNHVFAIENWVFIPAAETTGHPASNGVKDNKVLLGLRHADKAKADSELHGEGTWTMPGGKIRFGETFEQTANRELTEETSLIGRQFKLISLATDKVPDAHFITIGMLCTDFSGQVKTMEPEEIVEWRWFALNDLPVNMFPASRTVVENYLRGTIYQPTE